jgi:curli production assembly/transport component CsgF
MGAVLRHAAIPPLLLALVAPAAASELVYQPVNPAFGGDPFNGSVLLNEANAQNLYQDRSRGSGINPIQNFQRTIQSAILSRIASQLADEILGENAQDQGVFHIDSTTVSFFREGEVVHITITDGITGGTTQIDVPAPQF